MSEVSSVGANVDVEEFDEELGFPSRQCVEDVIEELDKSELTIF